MINSKMKFVNEAMAFSGSLLMKNSFLFNAFRNYKSDKLRIVYYHMVSDIDEPFYFDNKAISIEEFRNHMRFYKKNYDIISLNEAIQLAENSESLKRKLVISFDDGFKNNYNVVANILNDFNCSATFYLIGNCIDNRDLMWCNKLILINKANEGLLKKGINDISEQYDLMAINKMNLFKWSNIAIPMSIKEEVVNALWNSVLDISLEEFLGNYEPYMSSSDIIEMSRNGFEFGAHSMSHPYFKMLQYDEFEDEILNSINVVEALLEKKVSSFSYPFGSRSDGSFEEKFMSDNPGRLKTFLGTRNNLNNGQNKIPQWERDNMENPFSISMFRFYALSYMRSLTHFN